MVLPVSGVTHILQAASAGDPRAAAELLPLVYAELRRLAAHRLAGEAHAHTLQPTALVHEAWLRIAGTDERTWQGRQHFFAAAAEAMRRILVDQARTRRALKRGGGAVRVDVEPDRLKAPTPDDELLELDEALSRLAESHPEHAALVKLRYFAGLSADDAASALGISPSTADRRWAFARAWLKLAMVADER